jgi:hypothetical protein
MLVAVAELDAETEMGVVDEVADEVDVAVVAVVAGEELLGSRSLDVDDVVDVVVVVVVDDDDDDENGGGNNNFSKRGTAATKRSDTLNKLSISNACPLNELWLRMRK